MKKLLFSTVLLATSLLVSCESAVTSKSTVTNELSKQEKPSTERLTITTTNLNDAIAIRKMLMERMFSREDFSGIDMSQDLAITKKDPTHWDELDNNGNFICKNSWISKKYFFYRQSKTWILETSELAPDDTCQRKEDFKPFLDLTAYKSVPRAEFGRVFKRAALESQKQLVETNAEYTASLSGEVIFRETENGFSSIAGDEELGLEMGSVTNAWNIYKMYEDGYEIEYFSDEGVLNQIISSYSVSDTPFVSNYSRIYSRLDGKYPTRTELEKGIKLKDLLK